ncbi:hypothetical protein [Kitasatospora sp. SUK 42]|uniref:hypothetical protein n=1 Tax=Kitasatospora sp. SUK 42 TaxID=1588882 RepID=UPI0018C8E60C|nr:hypothetical protein [Kitasatospora sp. SUK 42]MBV2154570.1 hypothetical protein [Kitasatospora sp. SUK 42]
MKSMLAKAALTATVALALTGAATPAFAHVGVAGGGHGIATANPPFAAGEEFGVAHAGDVVVGGFGGGAATSTGVVGGGAGFAHVGD